MSTDMPLQGDGWGPPLEDVPLPPFEGEGWGPPAGFDATGEAVKVIEGEVIPDTADADRVVADLMRYTGKSEAEVRAVLAEALNAEVREPLSTTGPDERDRLPARIALDGELAMTWFRDPDAVQTLARDAQGRLLERISELAAWQRAQRAEGRPTPAVLAPELNLLGDAHDTLAALQSVFAAGAKHAKMLAGEVAHELADDPRKGATSVKVGDAHGTDLKVTRTQPTEVRVDQGELVDVFVGALCHRFAADQRAGGGGSTDAIRGFAQGARAMVDLYRAHAAAHSFKTSALDDLTRQLEGEGQDDLAIRLGHAYGRVSKGDPQVKIERAERKGAQTDG